MPRRYSLFGVPLGQWLTVLVIVALVYAIIFPVFQKVRQYRGPSCISNMKILGLAFVEYEQDADEQTPPGRNSTGNGWAGQIHSYANYGDNVYHCPDDGHDDPYISYAENRNIAKQYVGNFTNAAGTVALYEFTTLNCDPSKPEAVSATGLSAPQDSTRHSSPQDPFGLNFGFADGHVKYLTPGQVSNGASAVPPTHKGNYLATFAVK